MATNVGKIKSDRVSIKGVLNTEAPASLAQTGETHIAFDGTFRMKRDISSLRVAGCYDARSSHPWYDYALANAGSFTDFVDSVALSTMDHSQFDLLVVDLNVWAINGPLQDQIDAALAAGLSVAAIGNDTNYTRYSSGRTGAAHASHVIVYDEYSIPEEVRPYIPTSTVGSADAIGGMDTLKSGVLPLYYRDDSGQVTGFLYTHPDTGAKLFFDYEGVINNFTRAMMAYVAGFSTSGITTNAEVTQTDSGLYVESGTVNLESGKADTLGNNGKPFTGNGHSTNNGNVTGQPNVPNPPFEGAQVYKLTGGTPNGYSRFNLVSRIPDINWTGFDKPYMISVWVYFPSAMAKFSDWTAYVNAAQNNTGVDWHTGNKSPDATYGYWSRDITIDRQNPDLSVRDQWQRSWILVKPDSSYIDLNGSNDINRVVVTWSVRMMDNAANNGVNYCYVSALQVEEGEDLTAFVDGTRADFPRLAIPVVPSTDFSFICKVTPSTEYYRWRDASYNNEMWYLEDEATGLLIEYKDWTSNFGMSEVESRPFYDLEPAANWDDTPTHLHHYYPYDSGEPLTICTIKTGNTIEARIYDKNGTIIRNQSFTHTTGTLLSNFAPTRLVLGARDGTRTWSVQFHKASYYQYAITAAQADQWAKTSFKVTTDGDMYVDDIEESVYVPDGSIHFPLDFDTMDESKTISPAYQNAIVHEEGGAWVASYWNNQYSTRQIASQLSYVEEDGWLKLTRIDEAATYGLRGRADEANLIDGGTYTASMHVYNPMEVPAVVAMDWSDDGTSTKVWTIPPKEVMKVWVTGTKATYDATYNFFDFIPYTAGTEVWVKDIRIDRGEYRRPTKDNQDGWLAYNLYRDYGLDWSGEWSIVFFVKPVGTERDHVKTGYCISALGRYEPAATLTWGYIWFGKTLDSNAIYGSSDSAFTPSNYFDKWHMVSVVKSGDTIAFREYDISDTAEYTNRTQGIPGVAADHFVTPEGFDFQLGGWTTGNTTANAIFRDLIVAKRAFTDTDLDAVRKSWLSVNIDKARFSELYEGNL